MFQALAMSPCCLLQTNMDLEGYTAAFNLWAARTAKGFVGTMQSSWGKITVALMYTHHASPVPVISLRGGFEVKGLYKPTEPDYLVIGANATFPWPCHRT